MNYRSVHDCSSELPALTQVTRLGKPNQAVTTAPAGQTFMCATCQRPWVTQLVVAPGGQVVPQWISTVNPSTVTATVNAGSAVKVA